MEKTIPLHFMTKTSLYYFLKSLFYKVFFLLFPGLFHHVLKSTLLAAKNQCALASQCTMTNAQSELPRTSNAGIVVDAAKVIAIETEPLSAEVANGHRPLILIHLFLTSVIGPRIVIIKLCCCLDMFYEDTYCYV